MVVKKDVLLRRTNIKKLFFLTAHWLLDCCAKPDILAVPRLPNNLTHSCYLISSSKNLKSYLNVSDLWGDEVQQVCPILQTSLAKLTGA